MASTTFSSHTIEASSIMATIIAGLTTSMTLITGLTSFLDAIMITPLSMECEDNLCSFLELFLIFIVND